MSANGSSTMRSDSTFDPGMSIQMEEYMQRVENLTGSEVFRPGGLKRLKRSDLREGEFTSVLVQGPKVVETKGGFRVGQPSNRSTSSSPNPYGHTHQGPNPWDSTRGSRHMGYSGFVRNDLLNMMEP